MHPSKHVITKWNPEKEAYGSSDMPGLPVVLAKTICYLLYMALKNLAYEECAAWG